MIEAVSAILICEREVFVIKRQPHLRAFPGYLAFPGGKIDAEDKKNSPPHPLIQAQPRTHINALHRELSEELDFDLVASVANADVREVSLFGTAVTPAFEKTRFSAYYYKIVLNQKPEFIFDRNEIAEGEWHTLDSLCDLYRLGKVLMVVPMRNTLFALAEDISAVGATSFNVDIPRGQLPELELIDGLRTIPVPSNTLPPATTTNALLLGDSTARQILVDPSPATPEVYQQLLKTLHGRPLDAILITHHHPDHHERAMDLARKKMLPVLLTRTTLSHLEEGHGLGYAEGVELEFIAENQVVTSWKSHAVRVYELPGHDDGMVGLAPDNMAWFFVADLAQSNGSILIPEKGGDLTTYLASLRRVIKLNPQVVLPSHGIPTGGTAILEKTLKHRIEREKQIRPLFQAGATNQQILMCVYPDLNASLHPFALQTINQHLHKLKLEAGEWNG